MEEHPRHDVLLKFLLGELAPEGVRSVTAHLVDGCPACGKELEELARFLYELETGTGPTAGAELTPEEAAIPADSLSGYDSAIDRALSAVRLHGVKALKRKTQTKRVLQLMEKSGMRHVSVRSQGRYPVYEAALARAQALRHEDPQEMVFFTWFALRASLNMEEEGFTDKQIADFRAKAFGESANALRVAERLGEAEKDIDLAFKWARSGTGDPAIEVRLMKIRASLLGTQHRYWEAVKLLQRVHASYLRLGDRHEAGRALITQGIYTSYFQDAPSAIELIERGAELVDERRDPGLKTTVLQNQLWILVDHGLFTEAGELLREKGALLEILAGKLDRAKLEWLEGRLMAGTGQPELAEVLLREAVATFSSLDSRGHAALASLDLAVVVMHRGDTEEAFQLANEAFLVFRRLKINDAQVEALLVLREALESRIVTAGFLQSIADFLRRAEHDPYARYEPVFT